MNNDSIHKILLLAANPIGSRYLRLGEEMREIEEGLKRSKNRERYSIATAQAVRYRDIHRAILEHEPQIIHFSGHGAGEEGLVFEDETGAAKLVDGEALAGLFQLFSGQVECVVLNACYSQVQAEAIAQHIPCVIGMKKAIGDPAAIEFAVGFYDALGAKKSYEFAYKLGCNAIRMAGIPEQDIPTFLQTAQIEPMSTKAQPPQLVSSGVSTTQFDVFLAHNTQDKPEVKAIALALKQRNIKSWIDEEQIAPGRSFQDEIQQAIPLVKSAAIFIGSQGLGRWQSWELKAFIAECVERKIPVIPVLLPGVNNLPEDLVFLKQLRWVAFSNGVDDEAALDLLQWGITGEKPQSREQLEQKPGEIPPKTVLEEVDKLGNDENRNQFIPNSAYLEQINNIIQQIVDGSLDCLDENLSYLNQNQNKENLLNVLVSESNVEKIKDKLNKESKNIDNSKSIIAIFLSKILKDKKAQRKLINNYVAGNILKLLLILEPQNDFSDFDLSNISIWDVDFRDAILARVNFTNSDLRDSVFVEPLGCIHSIVFNSDGNYFATGDAHGSIRVHNTEKRELIAFGDASKSPIWSVAFSPNNKKLASSAEDGIVTLWNVENLATEEIRINITKTFQYNNHILSVSFSPNGKILAIGGDERGIFLQNVENFNGLQVLPDKNISCLVFNHKNNNILVSGSKNGIIRLWNITSKTSKRLKSDDTYTIRCIAFSPDGKTLASGGEDGKIRVWYDDNNWEVFNNLNTQPEVISHPDIKQVRALVFSPDGKTIAIGCINNEKDSRYSEHKIRFWSIATKNWTGLPLNAHKHLIRSLTYHPKSEKNLLLSGGDGRTIRFWDTQTRECKYVIKGYANRIWSIATSYDCNTIACCGEDNQIRILNKTNSSYKSIQILSKHTDWVWSVAFSQDNKFLASAGEDSNVILWQRNGNQWEYKATLKKHEGRVRRVIFSPDSNILASAGNDRKVLLWNINADTIDHKPTPDNIILHEDRILSLAFSLDGKYIASSSGDKVIKIKNLESNNFIDFREHHDNQVHTVAFSPNPDERILVSGSFDKTLKVWNIDREDKCHCIRTLKGHSGGILSVVFHPTNNSIVASAGHDKTIRLWNISQMRCIETLEEHKSTVESVIFTCDGNYLLSASQDQTIKVWDVSSINSSEFISPVCIDTIEFSNPYQDMKIAGIKGLSAAQIATLKALGAVS
ncbi:TIR domain-containing protein [Nostoc sp. CCY 9925]|uniref:TIR domain-containing protein n=1 Tax=Nostoc sp. CCY 9925 TaxID=3103865 RepID=UPI0039C64BFB